MDVLKRTAERLEAPECPNCRTAMRWFRSELVRDDPTPVVASLFICPNCKRARRSVSKFTAARGSPHKLAASRFQPIIGALNSSDDPASEGFVALLDGVNLRGLLAV